MSYIRHGHLPGEYIERHQHEEHQLVYVSDGILAVRTDHGAWVAGAQRAVWIPAGTWHEHSVHGHTTVHTLMFPTGRTTLPYTTPTVIAVGPLLRELLIACTEPGLAPAELRRLLGVINDRLLRADITALQLPTARDPRLAAACRLVLKDLSQPRTLTWLARQVGVGERQLGRLFRAEFGGTYPQWRTNARIFRAMIELSEGATVTQAAHRCGWATPSAFIDTFTRVMGRTPGSYRG
ncbi:AraC family transcriptional regulator [Streptomyces griseus]|uniref:AraC family transcriptional regulator n=1 Tax=Streptomyces griseus TaxID=1911 RepID=UPI0037F3D27F